MSPRESAMAEMNELLSRLFNLKDRISNISDEKFEEVLEDTNTLITFIDIKMLMNKLENFTT